MTDLAELDGVTVSARALGWDGSESDGTDWSLLPSDLPRLTTLIGTLTVNRVDDLGYTQFVVNGIPVDPATISEVDYSEFDVIVADGWQKVARDKDGKWTSGADQTGTPQFDDTPTGDYEQAVAKALTPGQKAAATKKAKKDALQAEAVAWLTQGPNANEMPDPVIDDTPPPTTQSSYDLDVQMADATMKQSAVMLFSNIGSPPTAFAIDHASLPSVEQYLQSNMSAKSYEKLNGSASQLRDAAKLVAGQHTADLDVLGKMGYMSSTPASAVDARRAVLRETGERKPTGGPGTQLAGGAYAHQFYGEAAISAMSLDKQKAIVIHHAGGAITEKHMEGWSADLIQGQAISADKSYKEVVDHLSGASSWWRAVAQANIPHSFASANALKNGQGKGLLEVVPKIHTAAKVMASSPLPIGKPSNWASMSPGKKAAWTKKHGKGSTAVVPSGAPKPADFDSWTPGKKAAWTKKANAGTVTTSSSGGVKAKDATNQHEVSTFNYRSDAHGSMMKAITQGQVGGAAADTAAHSARHHELAKKVSGTDQGEAWSSYIGGGYGAMNRYLKYGENKDNPKVVKSVAALKSVFADPTKTTPAPTRLVRGKNSGPMADLEYNLGQEFVEPGFGSWTTSASKAKSFAGLKNNSAGSNAIITQLVNSHNIPSLPGTSFEYETVMPPGVRYRVVGIKDFISSGTSNYQKARYRVLQVEVVV